MRNQEYIEVQLRISELESKLERRNLDTQLKQIADLVTSVPLNEALPSVTQKNILSLTQGLWERRITLAIHAAQIFDPELNLDDLHQIINPDSLNHMDLTDFTAAIDAYMSKAQKELSDLQTSRINTSKFSANNKLKQQNLADLDKKIRSQKNLIKALNSGTHELRVFSQAVEKILTVDPIESNPNVGAQSKAKISHLQKIKQKTKKYVYHGAGAFLGGVFAVLASPLLLVESSKAERNNLTASIKSVTSKAAMFGIACIMEAANGVAISGLTVRQAAKHFGSKASDEEYKNKTNLLHSIHMLTNVLLENRADNEYTTILNTSSPTVNYFIAIANQLELERKSTNNSVDIETVRTESPVASSEIIEDESPAAAAAGSVDEFELSDDDSIHYEFEPNIDYENEDRRLINAILNQDWDSIAKFLSEGDDIAENIWVTLLQMAAEFNKIDVVKALLARGFNPNINSHYNDDFTPTWLLLRNATEESINLFNSIMLNMSDSDFFAEIQRGIRNDDGTMKLAIVEYPKTKLFMDRFICNSMKYFFDVEASTNNLYGWNPLSTFLCINKIEYAMAMIDHLTKVNPDMLVKLMNEKVTSIDSPYVGYTPLLIMLEKRQIDIAIQMINLGADVSVSSVDGNNVIMALMEQGQWDIVENVLDKISKEHPENLLKLINAVSPYNGDVNVTKPFAGEHATISNVSMLTWALLRGRYEFANKLLDLGANVNTTLPHGDYAGYDPLRIALEMRMYDLAEKIIDKGAELSYDSSEAAAGRRAALTIVIEDGNIEIARELLARGVKLQSIDLQNLDHNPLFKYLLFIDKNEFDYVWNTKHDDEFVCPVSRNLIVKPIKFAGSDQHAYDWVTYVSLEKNDGEDLGTNPLTREPITKVFKTTPASTDNNELNKFEARILNHVKELIAKMRNEIQTIDADNKPYRRPSM
jgi:ankyrin repeat protein